MTVILSETYTGDIILKALKDSTAYRKDMILEICSKSF